MQKQLLIIQTAALPILIALFAIVGNVYVSSLQFKTEHAEIQYLLAIIGFVVFPAWWILLSVYYSKKYLRRKLYLTQIQSKLNHFASVIIQLNPNSQNINQVHSAITSFISSCFDHLHFRKAFLFFTAFMTKLPYSKYIVHQEEKSEDFKIGSVQSSLQTAFHSKLKVQLYPFFVLGILNILFGIYQWWVL